MQAGITKPELLDGLDELIAEYAPAKDVIELELAGRVYKFRALVDRAKYNQMRERAREFVELKAAPPALPEAAKWMDTDADTRTYAFILAETSIEPKLDKFRLLKVAKEAFLAFDELRTGYLMGLARTRATVEREEIERRKNASGETSLGETA